MFFIKTIKKFTVILVFLALIYQFSFLPILDPQEIQASAGFHIQTGFYMGNGDTQTISGLGFSPDLVIIKSDTNAGVGAFKTSAMPATDMFFGSNAVNDTGSNLLLTSDGFTVNTHAALNNLNIRYRWVAFGGSDCSSSGVFCVGSYTGNGSSPRTIDIGFQADFVVAKTSASGDAPLRTSLHPVNRSSFLRNLADNTTGAFLRDFSSTGFEIGATLNTNNVVYNFFAFKEVAGFLDVGSYVGDGADNRNITGVGFKPDMLILRNSTTATSGNRNTSFNTNESYGDSTTGIGTNSAVLVDIIQELQSDGFQVGTNGRANESGRTFYYFAVGGAPAYTTSSDSFDFFNGSYTGNGTSLEITDLPFTPQLIIIKNSANTVSVFRTSVMHGDVTASFATANQVDAITSLTSNGFTVGANTAVNNSGAEYHWQAFGGGVDPTKLSGSSDFVFGAYTGNALNDRVINRLPFQPDLVVTRRSGGGTAALKTSGMASGLGNTIGATVESDVAIRDIVSDGFTIAGLSGFVNLNNVTYYWFAFKNSSNFTSGTYVGTAESFEIEMDTMFQPDLVWIKRELNSHPIFRPSTLLGDASQRFDAVVNLSDRITDFTKKGFFVGGFQGETNTSNAAYRYMAWDGKRYNQSQYRFFENSDSTDVGNALALQNTDIQLSGAGESFRLRMLLQVNNGNLLTDGKDFKLQYVDPGVGTCQNPSGGIPNTYTDVGSMTSISFYNNASASHNTLLTANAHDPVDGSRTVVNQVYVEENPFSNTQSSIENSGQSGKWDFSLYDNGATEGTDFCFRVVGANNQSLHDYDVYPKITTFGAIVEEPQSLSFSISHNVIGFQQLATMQPFFATNDGTHTSSEVEAHTISASTNATDGYVVTLQGNTLTCVACQNHEISPIGGVSSVSNRGTEQFGLRAQVTSGTGTVASLYNQVNQFAFDNDNFPSVIFSGGGDDVETVYSVRYIANIDSLTPAGQYNSVITYTITASF